MDPFCLGYLWQLLSQALVHVYVWVYVYVRYSIFVEQPLRQELRQFKVQQHQHTQSFPFHHNCRQQPTQLSHVHHPVPLMRIQTRQWRIQLLPTLCSVQGLLHLLIQLLQTIKLSQELRYDYYLHNTLVVSCGI